MAQFFIHLMVGLFLKPKLLNSGEESGKAAVQNCKRTDPTVSLGSGRFLSLCKFCCISVLICKQTRLQVFRCMFFCTEIRCSAVYLIHPFISAFISSQMISSLTQLVDLDHGMKDKNLIDNIYFYSKRKPNETSKINDYQVPITFKPLYFRSFFQIRSVNHTLIK